MSEQPFRVKGHGDRHYHMVSRDVTTMTLRPVHGGIEWTFDIGDVYQVPVGPVREEPIIQAKMDDGILYVAVFTVTGDEIEAVYAVNGAMRGGDHWDGDGARERLRVARMTAERDGYWEAGDPRYGHVAAVMVSPASAEWGTPRSYGGYCLDDVCGWRWEGAVTHDEVMAGFYLAHPLFSELGVTPL